MQRTVYTRGRSIVGCATLSQVSQSECSKSGLVRSGRLAGTADLVSGRNHPGTRPLTAGATGPIPAPALLGATASASSVCSFPGTGTAAATTPPHTTHTPHTPSTFTRLPDHRHSFPTAHSLQSSLLRSDRPSPFNTDAPPVVRSFLHLLRHRAARFSAELPRKPPFPAREH